MRRFDNLFAYIKRKWWYLVLLLTSSLYVFFNRNDENIFQLKEFNAMNLIFVLWLILLLFPLFSEMEFLGIKLKKEVEEAKKEIKDGLTDLRLQLMDFKINNSSVQNVNIGNVLPSEQVLNDLKEEMQKNNENEIEQQDDDILSLEELGVSEQSIILFSVRLSIENSLAELCDKTDYNRGRRTITAMLRHLVQAELIPGRIYEPVIEIINICNRGVHGEIVSEKYIDFIREVLPKVQYEIEKANSDIQINVCPRCKYTGYTKFHNVCPKCGYINCD
ncbi:hypothetical protein [Acetobacterium wieringae]|uniref:hypothetical protein n=1 Tax=Acetobacterium wieringae TaxID=52694 RepID=UPI0026F1BF7B|nr:hypothetical protein [Acetobacterium wieringae]